MLEIIIYILILIPYAAVCWWCVLLFGRHKTRAFRRVAFILAVIGTPVLGIPFANWVIDENGF